MQTRLLRDFEIPPELVKSIQTVPRAAARSLMKGIGMARFTNSNQLVDQASA